MDILKRSLAPIPDAAWDFIDTEAKKTLRSLLSARRFIDVNGPRGWDFAAVSIGRLRQPSQGETSERGVPYRLHEVLPLVEMRIPFELSIWEMDNVARGAEDLDLQPVAEAARKAAAFEDAAVYQGLESAGILGLFQSARRSAIELSDEPDNYPDTIANAMVQLRDAGVEGPYAFVLGAEPFRRLASLNSGYPPLRQVQRLIEGPVVYSAACDGGLLVSMRGGDLELTLGHDFSIGYEAQDGKSARLFLSESFTFRIIDDSAFIPFQHQKKP